MIIKENYKYTTKDIGYFIKESTSLEELDFLKKNIEDSEIDKRNKDALLTMVIFKLMTFPLSEINEFYENDNNYLYITKRDKKYGLKNEEGLTKSDIALKTKFCPYCKKHFREDKESHFVEKNKRPRRIHESCIKAYVKEKYNLSQKELCKYINENYNFEVVVMKNHDMLHS